MSDERAGSPHSSLITHHSSLAEGIALFNAHRFWDAHEAWERIWLAAEGGEKRFLQGLIQLAAAYHHVRRGTYRGGVRLFDAALEKLAPFPPGHLGIERTEAVERAALHRHVIARGEDVDGKEFPKLRYNDPLFGTPTDSARDRG